MKRKTQIKKRLNIYLNPALKATIRDLAGSDGHSSQITEELLHLGLGLKKGETIEQRSLPIIRNRLQHKLRKSLSQLRTKLREDMQLKILNEMKGVTRRIVQAQGIVRRERTKGERTHDTAFTWSIDHTQLPTTILHVVSVFPVDVVQSPPQPLRQHPLGRFLQIHNFVT